jgi:hypothetical protein
MASNLNLALFYMVKSIDGTPDIEKTSKVNAIK